MPSHQLISVISGREKRDMRFGRFLIYSCHRKGVGAVMRSRGASHADSITLRTRTLEADA